MKAYTDISQSKLLAEILPLESADMCYIANSELINIHIPFYKKMDKEDIPCWSLAALLDVLPKHIKSPFGEINPFVGQVDVKDYRCVYLDGDWDSNVQTKADNPIDACMKMIEKLHEQKLL